MDRLASVPGIVGLIIVGLIVWFAFMGGKTVQNVQDNVREKLDINSRISRALEPAGR